MTVATAGGQEPIGCCDVCGEVAQLVMLRIRLKPGEIGDRPRYIRRCFKHLPVPIRYLQAIQQAGGG